MSVWSGVLRGIWGVRISRSLSGVAATNDGTTLVALHPSRRVEYSRTQPLPAIPEEPADASPLRLSARVGKAVLSAGTPESLAVRELARLTHTTTHRWYPRARDKRAKNTPPDREYL